MTTVQFSDGIHWVGAIDWNLRDFHGYETPRGTSYNAYLVRGSEKSALVDTVKSGFVPEMLHRVSELMPPEDIDYIVVNHVEPDHNGGLREVLQTCRKARVVASATGVKGVAEYHDGLVVDAVGADDMIDLGGRTLRFLPVPMVHWPDSMFTWCEQSKTLLSNDGFGQHIATSERFADELGLDDALRELGIYFANILMPVRKQVAGAVAKLSQVGWKPEVVATAHGVSWRGDDIARAVEAYQRFSSGETAEKVVIAYSTMWGSTARLAQAISDGVMSEGVECHVFDIADSMIADIAYELMDARAVLVGTSTLHHGMLHPVSGLLTYIDGLKPPLPYGATFGSFGWGGGANKQVMERLEGMGLQIAAEELTVKYSPSPEDLEHAREWGSALARTVRGAVPAAASTR